MSFTVEENRTYPQQLALVYQTTLEAIEGLGGKVQEQDAGQHRAVVQFDKKILGKVLGDRTQMEVTIGAGADGSSEVSVTVYPLDAIGRKLMFGARKGVANTVVTWFWAHLEHRLPKT